MSIIIGQYVTENFIQSTVLQRLETNEALINCVLAPIHKLNSLNMWSIISMGKITKSIK